MGGHHHAAGLWIRCWGENEMGKKELVSRFHSVRLVFFCFLANTVIGGCSRTATHPAISLPGATFPSPPGKWTLEDYADLMKLGLKYSTDENAGKKYEGKRMLLSGVCLNAQDRYIAVADANLRPKIFCGFEESDAEPFDRVSLNDLVLVDGVVVGQKDYSLTIHNCKLLWHGTDVAKFRAKVSSLIE
jgi:hypothetical protein